MSVDYLEGDIFKKIKPPEKSSMQKMIMRLSGNIIESERGANIVLFVIAILFFATSAYMIKKSFYSSHSHFNSEEYDEHVRLAH